MPGIAVNPEVLLSPVESGYFAFHTTAERFYELNPFAALIVELCDGLREPTEIAALLDNVVADVDKSAVLQWIDDAIESDLLTTSSKQQQPIREFSVEQLQHLSARLREDGKIEAAFFCQQQVAESEPGVPAHWCQLGELAHIVGKRDLARAAYQKYLQLEPEDAEIEHLLVSLRDEPAPARVPDRCIQQLYERFSANYENNMCDELGYEGPEQLAKILLSSLQDRDELSILDLGCGTGLAGAIVCPLARRLVGVDLSPEMLTLAAEREIYHELHLGEITAWLESHEEKFDVIMACDTLIYFGDLQQVIQPAVQRLRPGGVIAFSVERAESPGFHLCDSGRYQHHYDHLCDTAELVGLEITAHAEEFVRMEYGEPVFSHYVCLVESAATQLIPRSPTALRDFLRSANCE